MTWSLGFYGLIRRTNLVATEQSLLRSPWDLFLLVDYLSSCSYIYCCIWHCMNMYCTVPFINLFQTDSWIGPFWHQIVHGESGLRQEILFPWCISSYSLICLIPLVKREAGMFFAPCRGGGIWLIINATFWWKSVVMCLSEGSNFVTLGLEILLYCLVKWLETITMTDADGAFYSCIWRIWFFLELYVNCYKGVGCKKGTSCQSDSWKFSL